jgi:PTS system nitrogen regulatory IIA component
MKLSDILDRDSIILDLKAKDKTAVLEELAGSICRHETHIDKEALVRVLLERERLGSTGIGDGVAIPHGKLSGVRQPIVSFGRSSRGLDFDAMDGQPAYLFFLLLAPENSAGVHLKALAKIAKILKNASFRKRLMTATSKEELYRAIVETDDEP